MYDILKILIYLICYSFLFMYKLIWFDLFLFLLY